MLKKVYWAKVTKRKVYINLDSLKNNWKKLFIKKILKVLKLLPDIIYNYKYKKTNKNILSEITYLILKKQSERTKRHLMNSISPTAKLKNIGL